MRLRPIDLAREHGLSTQAVRNYEEAGILPPAERSSSGYRVYAPRHAAALRTFLALVPAHGHATAGAIMRAVNADEVEEALRMVDRSHAQLAEDRGTLEDVEAALRDLAAPGREPAGDPGAGAGPRPGAAPGPGGGATFIGPLAHRLGLRPATLRTWERAGLVVPRRDRRTGYRVYTAADVRDVLLAHQLRRGGHGLERTARVLEQVRAAGGPEPLQATLREWHERLTARGLALLAGAAALHTYLGTPR
ncbi:MerR family transcriptional regulator [Streptomyces sp. WAC06614]|uniref:MerR family transcriptional regulator n=1 Tax=Streptomyces sp. WAC06614 TaxID=2487416 RepID=UPI000F778953|nr:MerR family transcriptional regulator [Streptomyces sp. WAC06614]RSS58327.1 MerR family transcriptional regulator [Streptomyces sp. WAC06614]